MSASPRVAEAARLGLLIEIDGDPLPATCNVVNVECTSEIARIPTASLDILDGLLSAETFAISEQARFAPGKSVTIKAGYGGKTDPIFKGIITRHAIKVRRGRRSLLTITCHDEAVKLTAARRSCQYTEMSDTAVLKKLIVDCGLKADVDAGSGENPQMVQYTASDWDYIVLRAEALGCVVSVGDGTVSVKKPSFEPGPLLVTYGESLSDAEIEIDARAQVTSVSTTSWSPADQAIVTATSSEPGANDQSNIDGKTLAAVMGQTDALSTPATIAQGGLKSWADARILRSRLARIRGKATFHGSASAKVGTVIGLKGLGKRFDGDAYVSRISHAIAPNVWRTEVGFGLSHLPFSAPFASIEAPAAAGLVPSAKGLQIGKVKAIQEDPDGQFRIKVALPLIGSSANGLWARFACPYAGVKMGAHFLPELEDEVVVGFLNGDPGAAIVLGALHSSTRAAPFTPDEKNTFKGLVTSSQLKVWFDDQKKILCLETPGGHKATLSDEATSITLHDSNGNEIVMDKSGIKATSKRDFVVDVEGSVKLSGKQGIAIETPAEFSGKGLNVGFTAKAQFTAQGQASAQLTSTGQAVVKGAVVMIN